MPVAVIVHEVAPVTSPMSEVLTVESVPVIDSAPAVVAQEARQTVDIVETWGLDSFPASDPPANW